MRNRFDNELQELNQNLIKMGTLCEHAISLAMQCFEVVETGENATSEPETGKMEIKPPVTVAEVKHVEEKIDKFEHEIERQCLKLFLHEQPVARDLRIISSVLKMITDLERIGDQAVDIADLSNYTKVINGHVKTMAQEAITMLSSAIDSFVTRDLALATKTVRQDEVVDDLFLKVRCDIINILKSESAQEEQALDTLMIAKYLERIADHAVNVSEWVIFSITGLHKGESYDSYTGR